MKKILEIKTSRFPNRVYISFSDGGFLPLFIDDLVLLKLNKDQEIDEKKFNKIIYCSLFYLLYESALRQISYSPKSKIALINKLSVSLKKNLIKYKIDFDEKYRQITEDVILKIVDQNFLKDNDFLKYFVEKNKKKSNQEIKYLLLKQGFSESQINAYIGKDNEIEKIKNILFKKNFNKTDLLDFTKRNKIYSSLYRKGFSLDQIKAAFDCLLNYR